MAIEVVIGIDIKGKREFILAIEADCKRESESNLQEFV